MIRNLIASFVVALGLGSATVGQAQEIVPANHVHGGPVVVTEGTCAGGSCPSCSPCVRVPLKIERVEYCSKCKEKCAGTCSFFSFLSGRCGSCESCNGGDCETYCVRRLYKRVVTEDDCATKCVHVSELPAGAPVAVVTPAPAVAPAAPAPAPAPLPAVAPKVN